MPGPLAKPSKAHLCSSLLLLLLLLLLLPALITVRTRRKNIIAAVGSTARASTHDTSPLLHTSQYFENTLPWLLLLFLLPPAESVQSRLRPPAHDPKPRPCNTGDLDRKTPKDCKAEVETL